MSIFPPGNELLWIAMLLLNFAGILVMYRFFGRIGLYAWVPIAVIIANIQVIKTVQLFGLTSSLGNIVYATSFLATDILSENYGKKDAGKAVGIGFLSLFSLTVFMNLALMFKPAAVDFAQQSMLTLYSLLPRIALASFVAYGASQFHDVWAYSLMKKRRPDRRWIWLRNNASTMVSQAIDSLIFVTIAFAGSIPVRSFWEIVFSTYILKWIVAAADTPLVYLAVRWKNNNKINET
ncbi:MAG: VUT family protein [Spirochaetes bacterium]|nr:MAG: VUT family protein [Spirochaetota bacterium]RKX90102.1 MAG: VUT family protein [Spirochaetota bacterium]RKX98609.1 MAG: VUT family protein [Spirochaetota bacterium]